MASLPPIPKINWDIELRKSALDSALQAIRLGSKENVIRLAENFYKFLKGEENG